MSPGVAPDASNTRGSAEAVPGLKISVKPRPPTASESQCFFMIFFSILSISVEVLFSGACLSNRVLLAKAEIPTGTRHDCAVFLLASRTCCKNPSLVLEFTGSSSPYDDALTSATRGHPTARRLERRRRGSTGEVDPAGATRIAPARTSLHEPGARRPYPAN